MSGKKEQKFLADPSLGRLSKWLRILGYDIVYFSTPLNEQQFFEKARDENRLILTRSGKIITQLNKINDETAQPSESSGLLINYYFITHNHIEEQLENLIAKGLILQPKHWFTRCTECNEILKEIGREEVHGKVPDYIRETEESFRQCPHCKKIFWEGTHCKRMKEKIKFLFNH
tara:strand:+ start:17040 stop:17561 length:522 start_codon:yes stop_codon:yes gene_type:complete